MAETWDLYKNICTRDELENILKNENSNLRQQLDKSKKNCSALTQQLQKSRKNCSLLTHQLRSAEENLNKKGESEAALINQAKEHSEEIAKWKNLYARAQAQIDLDTVNEKLAIAVQNYKKKEEDCGKLESENSRVKDELVEKCAKIRELEEELKNEEEKWETEISKLKYGYKIQVENYEETIFKNDVELKELRKLVRDCDNIAKKDTKVILVEAHIEKSKVLDEDMEKERQKQHKLIETQNAYIKSLEDFLSICSEAMDENYVLQQEIESKDKNITKQNAQLQEAKDIVVELNSVAEKSEMKRQEERQIYETEKAKMESDVQKVKAVLIDKDEQLENISREREQFLGCLETIKDMVQFSGDDNFPLINQLEELKTCVKDKMLVMLQFCKLVDKVQKPPITTTTKSTLKTAKRTASKEKQRQLHAEDLTRRVTGRGRDDKREQYFCLCKFTSFSQQVLQKHIQRANQQRKFKCDKCSRRFLFLGRLEQHLRSFHGMQFEGAGGCRSCGILFKSREEKASHTKQGGNCDIILQNEGNEQPTVHELPLETEASNSSDQLRLPAPPAPPTSTVVNRNHHRYSDDNQTSLRSRYNEAGEQEQSHVENGDSMKELEPAPVQNSLPPPPKRRRVSPPPASDEDDEVDIETIDITDTTTTITYQPTVNCLRNESTSVLLPSASLASPESQRDIDITQQQHHKHEVHPIHEHICLCGSTFSDCPELLKKHIQGEMEKIYLEVKNV